MNHGSIERGVGCILVIPASLLGLIALADGAGPRGWRGISEFLGWATLCVATWLSVSRLLGQWRRRDALRYLAVASAVFVLTAFTYAIYWLGLYAPLFVKVAFTTSLQIVGSMATTGVIVFFAFIFWSGRTYS